MEIIRSHSWWGRLLVLGRGWFSVLITNSSWTNRLLIAVPFAIAALLNAVMLGVEHLHLHVNYIAGYGLVFSGPWVWRVNVADITNRLNVHHRCCGGFVTYGDLLEM